MTPPRRPALSVETLEGRAMPANLIPGDIVGGAVGAAGEIDAWTFTGATGDRIELITTSTPTQSGFNAYSDVYAPSGTRVAGFWANTNVVLTLAESGTFTVKVRDDTYLETGTYTVGLEGLAPISPGAAALVKGGIVSGSIDARTEKDQLTFVGTAGERIELITTSTPSRSGFAAYTDIYAPSGTRVGGFWANDNVVLTLAETGTYMLQVRDDNLAETGGYTVGFEGMLPISPNPSPAVKGGIVSGAIELRTEKDQWTFDGVEGQRIELISTSTPKTAGFAAYIDVYAPSGTRVAGFWAGNNVVLDLQETGTYMLQVRDDNYVETGSYTIGFEGLNPISPAPGALVKGGIVGGGIDARTEKDQWTFPAAAGDRIELISTSTPTTAGFAAYVDVYAPSGTRVGGFWANTNVTFDLTETGTYLVQVRDDNYLETGKYSIALESLKPASPDARRLPPNVTRSGAISTRTEKDQWTVRVPAGKSLRLVLSGTAITPGFRVYANVFDAAGNRVGGMWAGKQTFTLEPGTYTIQVCDASYLKRGNYKLTARLV